MFNYLKKCNFNSVTDLVLQTTCVIAFFGFLRCGIFTCMANFNSNIHLCIGDINLVSHNFVKLFLKTSKTDVYIQGVYIKLFKTDSDLCPYKLLRKLIMNRKSSNATEKDPLFVEEHNIALSRNNFIVNLRQSFRTWVLCIVITVDIRSASGQQQLVLPTVSKTI